MQYLDLPIDDDILGSIALCAVLPEMKNPQIWEEACRVLAQLVEHQEAYRRARGRWRGTGDEVASSQ